MNTFPDELKPFQEHLKVLDLSEKFFSIYFLYDEGDLVYIGRSKDVRQRIKTHVCDRSKVFDKVLYMDHDGLNGDHETALIHYYKPKYNRNVFFPDNMEETTSILKTYNLNLSDTEDRKERTIRRLKEEIRTLRQKKRRRKNTEWR